MIIYIGADHRGFKLKEYFKQFLQNRGYSVSDIGNDLYDKDDDFPDFAYEVGRRISVDYENARGILICGSGVGVDIVANKFINVRAVLAGTPNQAFDSRNDNNSNILCLGADYLEPEAAKKILTVWLETPFSQEERHRRRLKKISQIEFKLCRAPGDDI